MAKTAKVIEMSKTDSGLFKKTDPACAKKSECQSAGDDCTVKGMKGRDEECFVEKTVEEPAILTEQVNLGEPTAVVGEEVTADGEPSNEVEKQEEGILTEQGQFFCPECKSFNVDEFIYENDFQSMKCNDCQYTGSPGEDFPATESIVDASFSIPKTQETVTTGGHKTFPRTLRIDLSEEELADSGSEMARLIGIWTKAKLDKKAYDRASKNLIDETEEKYIALAESVAAGSEEREVLCYWEYKPETGSKALYRCDTGDVVEEANMELLDYENCPGHKAEESIENAETLRQEQSLGEDSGSETGGQDETQGEGHAEGGNAATGEISQSSEEWPEVGGEGA